MKSVDLKHMANYTDLIQKLEFNPDEYKRLMDKLINESESFRQGFGNRYRLTSDEINDVTSACLLKLIDQIRIREAQGIGIENLQAYYTTIFKNEVRDYLSYKYKTGLKFVYYGDMSNFEADSPNHSDRNKERNIGSLIRIVEQLKPKDQVVVIMRYYGNFSQAEIGDVLKISEDSVKTTLHRALGKMRRLLIAEGQTGYYFHHPG